MSIDMNRSISYIDQTNKAAFMVNLIKTNSTKILDSLSKEFLLQVFCKRLGRGDTYGGKHLCARRLGAGRYVVDRKSNEQLEP